MIKAPQTTDWHPPVTLSKSLFLRCYDHLFESKSDIDLLYGGRDSGKSRWVAMWLVYLCLKMPYFRCVLVRKVFNTIRESQYQMIKDVVEEWGLSHLFVFNVAPLEIKCQTGGRFICRGMDEPGNLKSITNPNYAWVEEGNQIDIEDFILLMTSLRYNKARVKTWYTFNPETYGEYTDFWIYKTFYRDREINKQNIYQNFCATWSIPVGEEFIEFTYSSTHTTYKDNRYVRAERKALLENMINIDPYYYKVYTLGHWGNRLITDPYCYAYSDEKHVAETKLLRQYETILSFDFNVNPITCGVYQEQGPGRIRAIEAINLGNSDIYKLCDYINIHYRGCLFRVTGDATGRNTSALVQDGINYYTVIKHNLFLSSGQLVVPTVNPAIEENRVLVNTILHSADIKFDPINCKHLIFDCKNVSVNDIGKIDKGTRTDPKKRADHLDHFRYYLNTFHKKYLKQ